MEVQVVIDRLVEVHSTTRHLEERVSGRYGILRIGDFRCWTTEAPWINNKKFVSCIPDGVYTLEPHHGSRYPDSWALVGNGVAHEEEPGCTRFACVFHDATGPWNLKGCVALSMGLKWDYRMVPILIDSAKAVSHFFSLLSTEQEHSVLISSAEEIKTVWREV